MTQQEFALLAKGMKAVFTDPKFLPDRDAYEVWYGLLKDIPYEAGYKAVMDILRTSRTQPTIADIISRVHRNAADDAMTEMEAWSLVRKAIQRSIYDSETEFRKLPKAVRKAIGSPSNLREMAMMPENTVESVEQSHFIKAYKSIVARQEEDEKADFARYLAMKKQERLE